jgi:nucleoside-diphosphate-sugar epimerase
LTSGEQDWSYLHAIDFASAALSLCQEDITEEVINIGHPKTVKIRDVATEVSLQMRSEEFLDIGAFPTRSDQVFYLKPSVDNLVRYGWAPKIELSYGLTSYINWALKKELSFEGIKLTNFV